LGVATPLERLLPQRWRGSPGWRERPPRFEGGVRMNELRVLMIIALLIAVALTMG